MGHTIDAWETENGGTRVLRGTWCGALALVVPGALALCVGCSGASSAAPAAPATVTQRVTRTMTAPPQTATVTVTARSTVTATTTVTATQLVTQAVTPPPATTTVTVAAPVPDAAPAPEAATAAPRAFVEQPAPRPGGAASFASCAQAKAAGAAPLHVGDPGYSTRLDRDGDGVACEN